LFECSLVVRFIACILGDCAILVVGKVLMKCCCDSSWIVGISGSDFRNKFIKWRQNVTTESCSWLYGRKTYLCCNCIRCFQLSGLVLWCPALIGTESDCMCFRYAFDAAPVVSSWWLWWDLFIAHVC